MKKYFENVAIDCWVHIGRLARAEPCICMRADAEAVALLLRAVDELARENPPAKRKLTLQSKRRDALRSLSLRYAPDSAELRKLRVAIENGTPVLEFTRAGMADVTSALADWMEGAQDFCLYARGKRSELGEKDRSSGELSFWVTMLP